MPTPVPTTWRYVNGCLRIPLATSASWRPQKAGHGETPQDMRDREETDVTALPRRVLAVDDCLLNRRILQKLLRHGYVVQCAADGLECLQMVNEFHPHVVLLDVMMPGLDGYEVCRRLKSSAGSEFRQVILLTGRCSLAERLRGYENLCDDYLVKPFDHDELLCKVRVQFRLWEQFMSGNLAETCNE